MELICDLSREGNDCWIKEKWYWASDFNIILSIYDDGYDLFISKYKGISDSEIPEKVVQAFNEMK